MTTAQRLQQSSIQKDGKEDMQQSIRQENMHLAKEMLSEMRLDIQTTAQQLRKEYEQKGRQKEKLVIAKKMLDAHESKDKVHQFTGLSRVEIEALA